jgi:mannose-6-phosphate isomerase-like protein (cupin superfamily)
MKPVLLRPGEGETTSDRAERTVRILAGLPELAVTHSRYATGESGPESHVHREHADCFWVLDGELAFELGHGEVSKVGADTWVMAPAGVVHTFRNEGPAEATFLNVHAPSKNFHDYMRAMRDGKSPEEAAADEQFDTYDPPADGGLPASAAIVRGPDQGETLVTGTGGLVFKAGIEDAGGHLSLTDSTVPPGFPGPVRHYHEHTVDSFYVLDGTLTLTFGEETVEAGPGSYALAPPGAVHTFSNPGESPVRVLNLMAPGGFERYLKEAFAPGRGGPPDPAEMARIASKYDFHLA